MGQSQWILVCLGTSSACNLWAQDQSLYEALALILTTGPSDKPHSPYWFHQRLWRWKWKEESEDHFIITIANERRKKESPSPIKSFPSSQLQLALIKSTDHHTWTRLSPWSLGLLILASKIYFFNFFSYVLLSQQKQ